MDERPEHGASDEELEELVFACLDAADPRGELQRRAGDRPALFAAALRHLQQVSRLERMEPARLGAEPAPRDDDPATWPSIPGTELEALVGRGGQGLVFRGRQRYLERTVAVKVLAPELQTPAFVDRFRREARMLAGLQHPHVVACHDAGLTDDGRCFLVMEWIAGPDLRQWLDRHGPLPAAAALDLVRQLATALDHAHRSGLVHRDVKPENVVLQPREGAGEGDAFPFVPKLADLGLARSVEAGRGFTQLTPVGAVVGTPATMAPEQFDGPEHVDHRADIYGLGCVLHHALAGRPAFTGTAMTDLIVQKTRLRPDATPLPIDGVEAPVRALVTRMLAAAAADRPQSCAELLAALDQVASPAGAAGRARRAWLALPLLAAGTAAWWLATSNGAAPPPPELVVVAPAAVVEGTTASLGAVLANAPATTRARDVSFEQTAGPEVLPRETTPGSFTFVVPYGTAGAELVFVTRAAELAREVRLQVAPDPARPTLVPGAPLHLFGRGEADLLATWRVDQPERWSQDESQRGPLVNSPRGRTSVQRLLPGGPFELRGAIEPRFRYVSPAEPRVPIASAGLRVELGSRDSLALVITPDDDERFVVQWCRQSRLPDDSWTTVALLGRCVGSFPTEAPLYLRVHWNGARFVAECGPFAAPATARTEAEPAADWNVRAGPGHLELHADRGVAVFTDWTLARPQ